MDLIPDNIHMELPQNFLSQIQSWPLQPADREAFLHAFSLQHHRGVRFNTLRGSGENAAGALRAMSRRLGSESSWPAPADRIPWAKHAYYLPDDLQPGIDPAHPAGLYYLQEPSAMLPAEVLAARPGELIADLCAAPGGKTTQLAADMCGEGLLISNDISQRRALVLRRNIEQLGLTNVQVTDEAPALLAEKWGAVFDAILLDAPCSGEGMFRRDSRALTSWSEYGPQSSVEVQAGLLEEAAALLRPGGRLVYSTCTFNPEENEYQISSFLARHPEFSVQKPMLAGSKGIRGGMNLNGLSYDPEHVLRIWPQDGMGEGHFCALLVKDSDQPVSEPPRDPDWIELKGLRTAKQTQDEQRPPKEGAKRKERRERGMKQKTAESFSMSQTGGELLNFIRMYMTEDHAARYLQGGMHFKAAGSHLHILPAPGLRSDGLSFMKFGVHAGELKGRPGQETFVPSHSFLLSQAAESWRFALHWEFTDARIRRLMRGETLQPETADLAVINAGKEAAGKGAYFPILTDGYPFAWVKLQGKQLKNLFPPGWRR